MTTQFLTVPFDDKSITIAGRVEGDGPTVLFLHGWLHSSEIWNRVTARLAGEYKLVAIDLPGFGETAALERPNISLAGYARLVLNIITMISATYPLRAVVADSLSGVLVAHACGLNPTFPRTHLLISGCPFDGLPITMRIAPTSFFLIQGLKCLRTMPQSLRDRLIRWFSKFTIYNLNNFGPEIIKGVVSADPETAAILFNELKRRLPPVLSDALSRQRGVFLRGKFDRVAGEATTKEWARRAGAGYIELGRSAHTPMIEEPDGYAQAIRTVMREE